MGISYTTCGILDASLMGASHDSLLLAKAQWEALAMREHHCFHGHDVYLLPSRDSFLVYAPTLRKLLKVSPALAHQVDKFGLTETPLAGASLRTLLSILERALQQALRPLDASGFKSKYFHLALGLTRNCTLACLYCHAEADKDDEMREHLLSAAIDHAFATAGHNQLKGVNVSFAVGGEPTTNWDLFTDCVGQIERASGQHGIPSTLSITTNGYYNSGKRRFIADHIQNILVSFDGPPDIQNLHRPTRDGRASFPAVRDSAKYFSDNAHAFAIRATVSNRSVNRMVEIVDFFYNEFGNRYHLVFEPLVPLGRALTNDTIIAAPSHEDFVNSYIAAKQAAQEVGLEVKTSAANHKRLTSTFCGAMSIPSFTVTTRGLVTTCERDSEGSTYGYGVWVPESGQFVFEESQITRNKALLSLPEKCLDCFCKWHCAGDCPDVRSIGYDRCYVNRKLLQYELERAVATANMKEANNVGSRTR